MPEYSDMQRKPMGDKNTMNEVEFIESKPAEHARMKRYTLIIDPSASSPADNKLFIHETDTVEDAIDKLNKLDLDFDPGKIYCATIGRRLEGRENRYEGIMRTNDGDKWIKEKPEDRHPYIPETWGRVDDWTNIDLFRKAAREKTQDNAQDIRHYAGEGLGVNVREELKKLGCRFDPDIKQWYHPTDKAIAEKAHAIILTDAERFKEIQEKVNNKISEQTVTRKNAPDTDYNEPAPEITALTLNNNKR